jgi:copper chaperone CopZ
MRLVPRRIVSSAVTVVGRSTVVGQVALAVAGIDASSGHVRLNGCRRPNLPVWRPRRLKQPAIAQLRDHPRRHRITARVDNGSINNGLASRGTLEWSGRRSRIRARRRKGSRMTRQTFAVDGLHCAGCADMVKQALLKLDGVSGVEITLQTGAPSPVHVETDPR